MFKNKVLFIAGGTSFFRRRLCDTVLRRYPEISKLTVLVGSRKEFEKEEEYNKNPFLTIRKVDFLQQKSLLRELEGADYLIYAEHTGEFNPFRSTKSYIRKNINGTQNIIEAAKRTGLEKALFIGSEKVCNPVDLSGSVSLCMEKLWIAGNNELNNFTQNTKFSAVRLSGMAETMYADMDYFFKCRDNGCITIIDRLATKFWITPDEGIAFILKYFAKAEGGEIYIPKLPSISLKSIAQIICPECQIKETGLTENGMLHETLFTAGDSVRALEYNDYYVIQPQYQEWNVKEYRENTGGREVGPGFSYSSETNTWVMSLDELEFIITKVIYKELAKNVCYFRENFQ